MDKEERRKQIKIIMKTLVDERRIMQSELRSLKVELWYINGHYDKTWEEKYKKKN